MPMTYTILLSQDYKKLSDFLFLLLSANKDVIK
nr:hypothetical protein BSM_00080 [uncultured archaeon]